MLSWCPGDLQPGHRVQILTYVTCLAQPKTHGTSDRRRVAVTGAAGFLGQLARQTCEDTRLMQRCSKADQASATVWTLQLSLGSMYVHVRSTRKHDATCFQLERIMQPEALTASC